MSRRVESTFLGSINAKSRVNLLLPTQALRLKAWGRSLPSCTLPLPLQLFALLHSHVRKHHPANREFTCSPTATATKKQQAQELVTASLCKASPREVRSFPMTSKAEPKHHPDLAALAKLEADGEGFFKLFHHHRQTQDGTKHHRGKAAKSKPALPLPESLQGSTIKPGEISRHTACGPSGLSSNMSHFCSNHV